MEYTDKQVKRILSIQEFIEIVNTLSKMYKEFYNKELMLDTLIDKKVIYKVYCSSIYNLVVAIKNSKEFFQNTDQYIELENMINEEFVADNVKYYSNEKYSANLFQILQTIRNQANHFERDDDDNNVLFEAYVDDKIIEKLRIILNNVFYDTYYKIDKNQIKKIILSKIKIQYSFDQLSNKIDLLKSKIQDSQKNSDILIQRENEIAFELLEHLLNPQNIYDLHMKNPEAIGELDSIELKIENSMIQVNEYINSNGSKFEAKIYELAKKYLDAN